MKNAISYYYNLIISDIIQSKNKYYFIYDKNYYVFEECNRSVSEIYELYNLESQLYLYNIYLHQMIFNVNGELLTNVNGKYYVLMKMFIHNDRKIEFSDIKNLEISIDGIYKDIKKDNWRVMWISKIDYIEYQISENKIKYKKLRKCIDYYIGLTENAILLLYGVKNEKSYLSHYRIKNNYKLRDLYNPLNIIIDTRVRNIAEYIKNLYLHDYISLEDILKILSSYNLSNGEKKLLFSRILFPSEFFDEYDLIVSEVCSEDIIEKYNSYIDRNIDLIKYIYNIYYKEGVIPEIEWIKKVR